VADDGEPVQAAGRPPRRGHRRGRGSRAAYLFVLPLMVIFAGFYAWPALSTALSSFFSWGLLRPWRLTEPSQWNFVGLNNYRDTLTDPDFWTAAVNTGVWLVVFPALVLVVSLVVSILIWFARRGSGLLRSIFILPMTISLAAAGVIWSFVYNPDPDVGVLNAILHGIHLRINADWGFVSFHTGNWLSDMGRLDLGFATVAWTNLAVILPAVWAFSGFGVITFSAGLTSLPHDLVEAAQVDGARPGQIVRHVVIPALRSQVIVVTVVSVIFALRTFDIVFVATGGGPGQQTEVLALLLWQEAFAYIDSPQAGAAAAIAVLMSVVLIALSAPYLRRLTGGRR
jgi:ABC-type sugar transport system permease subunit